MVSFASSLLFCLVVATGDGPHDRATVPAVDRIVLKDGAVVLGLVTGTMAGRHGAVDFVVRRAWAESQAKLKAHLARWDKSASVAIKAAVRERQGRLESWKRDRSPNVGADDPILGWIDRELGRLAGANQIARYPLIPVHLPANELRSLERRPRGQGNLLRLAWLRQVPDVESLSLADLEQALDARGVDLTLAVRGEPTAIDRLLPPMTESAATWLGRRAATEVTIDPDVRFLRYNDLVLPDAGAQAGQPLGGIGLETAMSELKRLLDPDQNRADPLVEKLKSAAARGHVGAQVTRLEMAPDLSQVTVECVLLVRGNPDRWVTFGTRSATVKLSDVQPDAARELAADPQVQGAFKVVGMLGLGAIPADLEQRSLRMGAATSKAMGLAREAFSVDLKPLVLPVLEPAGDAFDPGRKPVQ
jgi:hypothetical protein